MTEEIIVINKDSIKDKIFEVRGKKVMLDFHLAEIYGYTTKDFNRQVKNNIEKFDADFRFQLNVEEVTNLSRCKNFTSMQTKGVKGGRVYMPYAFTEQGIYMLATILKSKVATNVSIAIMDTFVKMRHYINYNKTFLPHRVLLLEDKVDDNTKRINELFDKFDCEDIAKNHIFFEGEFYDAYSLLLDILDKAENEIIIIDNYAGKELLDILKSIDKRIIIVSKNIDDKLIEKYESQLVI